MTNTSTSAGNRGGPAGSGVAYLLRYEGALKRVADIILAILLLPMLLPIIGLLYLIIRSDGGPGFFGHKRVGREGKIFKCWKLRSMVPDAEEHLREHLANNPAAAAEWERDFKLRDDPRITRLGAFIRKTSLDELPQIWNVLRGEMSLVGPRPVTSDELSRYGAHQWAYLMMRPGVTGLWQVSGRNDISYDERVALDTRYCREVSAVQDAIILFNTIGAITKRTGV
ncbi:exopolysaccharide production protein [Donghicola eburneus]|mgnify:CR=1 FL=1|uniref:Exopolysaccharide production protein n=1 Tax=Donghicola eburneus TaxID=393278 RepID=A0A1M4MZ51_9RHOB|nr:exopolysaccharide production protein [Donghicola eburneus]